jgi:hypothetical protein
MDPVLITLKKSWIDRFLQRESHQDLVQLQYLGDTASQSQPTREALHELCLHHTCFYNMECTPSILRLYKHNVTDGVWKARNGTLLAYAHRKNILLGTNNEAINEALSKESVHSMTKEMFRRQIRILLPDETKEDGVYRVHSNRSVLVVRPDSLSKEDTCVGELFTDTVEHHTLSLVPSVNPVLEQLWNPIIPISRNYDHLEFRLTVQESTSSRYLLRCLWVLFTHWNYRTVCSAWFECPSHLLTSIWFHQWLYIIQTLYNARLNILSYGPRLYWVLYRTSETALLPQSIEAIKVHCMYWLSWIHCNPDTELIGFMDPVGFKDDRFQNILSLLKCVAKWQQHYPLWCAHTCKEMQRIEHSCLQTLSPYTMAHATPCTLVLE